MKKMKLVLCILFLGMSIALSGCSTVSEDLKKASEKMTNEKKENDVDFSEIENSTTMATATTERLQATTTNNSATEKKITTEATTEKKQSQGSAQGMEMAELKNQVSKQISDANISSENVSVFVKDLKNNNYINMDRGSRRAASLIKLYVAGTVYEQIQKGTLSKNNEIVSLIRQMITVSANDACNTLVRKLGNGNVANGMGMVNSYCANHGFSGTSMGRLMLDFSSKNDNYTSVSDCTKFLRLIYSKELPGSEEILSFMKQQTRRTKIPAGIPSGVVTANKTGELDNTENDVAVIYKNDVPYIVCVMVTPISDTASARRLITNISKIVYENIK